MYKKSLAYLFREVKGLSAGPHPASKGSSRICGPRFITWRSRNCGSRVAELPDIEADVEGITAHAGQRQLSGTARGGLHAIVAMIVCRILADRAMTPVDATAFCRP